MELHILSLKRMNNENGFVLVGALLILLLLMVIGIASTTSTMMELQVAGSDRTHKETFYAADGGTHVGTELVEQSIWDFPTVTLPLNSGVPYLGKLFVTSDYKEIFLNHEIDIDDVTQANRDAFFNYGVADPTGTKVPRTDIQIGSQPIRNEGGALQQLAGYEGKGKGAHGGGISRLYEIHSKSFGNNNSESWLIVEWRHVL